MRLAQESFEHTTVVRMQGEFGTDDVASFRQLVEGCIARQHRDFILEVSDLETIDSQGLESLLWLQEYCGDQLGQLRLAGASPQLEKILEITRLSPRFDRHPDVDAAVKSLRI